jgi:hypothetical protein
MQVNSWLQSGVVGVCQRMFPASQPRVGLWLHLCMPSLVLDTDVLLHLTALHAFSTLHSSRFIPGYLTCFAIALHDLTGPLHGFAVCKLWVLLIAQLSCAQLSSWLSQDFGCGL